MPDYNRIAEYFSSPPATGPTGPVLGDSLDQGQVDFLSDVTVAGLKAWPDSSTFADLPLSWVTGETVIDASSLLELATGDSVRLSIYDAGGTVVVAVAVFTISHGTANYQNVAAAGDNHVRVRLFSARTLTTSPTEPDDTSLLGRRIDIAVRESGESAFDALPEAPEGSDEAFSFWCAPAVTVQDFGRLQIDLSGNVEVSDEIRRSITCRFDSRLEGGGVVLYQGRAWSIAAVTTEESERVMQIDLRG